MVLEEQLKFKADLRTLFEKYGVDCGATFFIHGGGLHVTEVHVTGPDELIITLTNAITEAVSRMTKVPVQQFWEKKGK